MAQMKYYVHRTTHKIHAAGKCKYTDPPTQGKYEGFCTLEEAYAKYGKRLSPCRYCSIESDLEMPE